MLRIRLSSNKGYQFVEVAVARGTRVGDCLERVRECRGRPWYLDPGAPVIVVVVIVWHVRNPVVLYTFLCNGRPPPPAEIGYIYSEAEGVSHTTKMPVSTRPPRITRPTQYRQVQAAAETAAVATAVEAAAVEN